MASRQWDERRLAYPIGGHKKGTYLLTYFRTDGSNLKDIVADCHLSDLILRELILKVHPKLEDHLVNQAMTSTPNVDAEDGRATRTSSTTGLAAAAATTEPAGACPALAGSDATGRFRAACNLGDNRLPSGQEAQIRTAGLIVSGVGRGCVSSSGCEQVACAVRVDG